MKRPSIGACTLVGGISLAAAVLMGCMPDTSAPDLPAASQTAALPATASPDAITLPAEFAAEPFVDVECLACHQDEAQLRDLAVEAEAAESLSEGPG